MSAKQEVAYDRLAVDLDQFVTQLDPREQAIIEPVSNPYNSAHLHSQSLGAPSVTRIGKIVSSVPYLHWYRVQLADGDGDMPCCKASDCSFLPIGVRSIGMIPVGSMVVVLNMPHMRYGIILAVLPDFMTDPALVYPDWVAQGSPVGFKREPIFNAIMQMCENEGGMIDFSCNRPLDGLGLDWGYLSELGNGIFIDPFWQYFRIDEETGLFLFNDQKALLTGHHLELNSALSQHLMLDDEGEGHIFRGESPYPWEALGALRPNQELATSVSAVDVQYNKPLGALEPKQPGQTPFFRVVNWGGYLGQGGKRVVMAPQANQDFNLNDGVNTGLWEENVALDGSYFMRSAKQVTIAKRTIIPVPTQLRAPEDGLGDDAAANNYRFAGMFGTAPKHKVGDRPPPADNLHVKGMGAILDQHSYLFNWQGLHPFYYHKNDFYTPEESANQSFNSNQVLPSFSDLSSKYLLDPPIAKQVNIDHRYGNVNYYETTAYLSFLDDGSVVIGDGYGSEIRMGGGNIFLQCPGDVVLQPGRSVVAMGADDIVLRAKNSVDISASAHDVRIAAGRNLQAVAGITGTGGMLFESKSVGEEFDFDGKVGEDVTSSGILFKSAFSPIVTWSAGIYLRTGGPGGGIAPGDIVLDAAQGLSNIVTVSSGFNRFIETAARDYFGIQSLRGLAEWSDSESLITSGLAVQGTVDFFNGLIVQGQIDIVGGHIASELSEANKGLVGDLKDIALAEAEAALELVEQDFAAEDANAATQLAALETDYYADGEIGSGSLQEEVAFSYRNQRQYNTENFVLVAARWQQLASFAMPKWKETPLQYQSQQLMPYPGIEQWMQNATYNVPELTLTDLFEGISKGRSSGIYENTEAVNWITQVPDGNYPTIM